MYRPDVYGLATGDAMLTVTDGKEKLVATAPTPEPVAVAAPAPAKP